MRKRVIIVPKDKTAERDLDFDEAKVEQLIEITLTDKEFMFLFKNGIINLINQKGSCNIDDYEDDSVKGSENIKKVIDSIQFCLGKGFSHNKLIVKILNQFIEALNRDTGVYFFF